MSEADQHEFFDEYRVTQEDAEDEPEDDDDEELSAEDDQYGRIAYLTKCDELAINPVSQILRFLETEEMQVMHYGLGGKGTLALVAAISSNSMVTTLRLCNNNIDDPSLTVLIRSLAGKSTPIIELNISGNKIGSNGCQALAEILENGANPLQILGLSKMHIQDKDGARILAVLEGNSVLKSLDMSHNELGDKAALAASRSLQTNLTLNDLNLSWNKLRSKGVAQLSQGLAPNLSVQFLGLAWVGMGDAGAEAFGNMLKTNNGLVDLDLSGNSVTGIGVPSLAAGIGASVSLAEVSLDNNDLREDGGKLLLEAVEANRGLVKMRLDNCNISFAMRAKIEETLGPRQKVD